MSEREEFLKLCSIRELFSGRFDNEEIAFLLQRFNGDQQDTINFILSSEPQEVRRLIDEERESWTTVLPAEKRRNLPPKIENMRQQPQSQIVQRARSGRVDTSCRMFTCKNCDKSWWRKVPDRKPVSKCDRCKVRYDALLRDEEFGWAAFQCPNCSKCFSGWCGIWYTSPCFSCHTQVEPTRIIPPQERKLALRDRGMRVSQSKHLCSAPDCLGRMYMPQGQGHVGLGQYVSGARGLEAMNRGQLITCVHPISRRNSGRPIVVLPSEEHDSTGSTVDTFLPQGDLNREFEIIPLQSIPEHNDSDSNE